MSKVPTQLHSALPEVSAEVHDQIVYLLAIPQVRSACEWFHLHESQLCDWQFKLAQIPAPPFGESARATWLGDRFRELALEDVQIDPVGNVVGLCPGPGKQCLIVSAHID